MAKRKSAIIPAAGIKMEIPDKIEIPNKE